MQPPIAQIIEEIKAKKSLSEEQKESGTKDPLSFTLLPRTLFKESEQIHLPFPENEP